jgi:hypothetical protein
MKKFIHWYFYLAASLLSLASTSCFAQFTFQKILQDSANKRIIDIIPGHRGSSIATGNYSTDTSNTHSIMILKADENGDPILSFSYQFNSVTHSFVYGLIETLDHDFIVSGYAHQVVNNYPSPFLMKIDSAGTKKWLKIYSRPSTLIPSRHLFQTNDGGIVMIGGSIASSSAGGRYVFLMKTDKNGLPIINLKYSAPDSSSLRIDAAFKTRDSGFLISGYNVGASNDRALLMKTDSMGVLQWADTLGISGPYPFLTIASVVETKDKGLILGTFSYSGLIIIKLDSNRNIVWSKSIGSGRNYAPKIIQTSDGNFAILATMDSTFTESNIHLLKITENGSILWKKKIGGTKIDEASSFLENTDHGFTIAGSSTSFGNNWSHDIYFVKTDSMGNSGCNEMNIPDTMRDISVSIGPLTLSSSVNTFSVDTSIVVVRTPMQLSVNTLCSSLSVGDELKEESLITSLYPNPAQSLISVNITHLLKKEEKVVMSIMDLSGKKMREEEVMIYGGSSFQISTSALSDGIYFLKLQGVKDSGISSVSKLVIMR